MPRSNRPRRSGRPVARPEADPVRPLLGGLSYERARDGEWHVRPVPGAATTKAYRCPGCQQLIAPGTAHLLAWPGDDPGGPQSAIDARRHWHRACWGARSHRHLR